MLLARRGSGNRSGLGKAEPKGTVCGPERGEHGEHQFADIDFGGLRGVGGQFRFVQRAFGVFADEVTGTGARLDQAAIFQQVVGLEHGGRADAVGAAGMAHRGHLLARAEHAGTNQLGNLVGEFFVAFHPVLVHRRKG